MMLLKISLVIATVALLLSACSSDADEPQLTQSNPTTQAQQTQTESATAYVAGQSGSVQDERESEPPAQASPAEQAEQTTAEASGAQPDAVAQAQQQAAAPESAQPQQAEQEQPSTDDEPEPQAMVGQIIESGQRAGLIANRHVVGDPDAPIGITEYSDFL